MDQPPRKNPQKKPDRKDPDRKPKTYIDTMLGRPEPTFRYFSDLLQKTIKQAWPIIVIVLLLYFIFGP